MVPLVAVVGVMVCGLFFLFLQWRRWRFHGGGDVCCGDGSVCGVEMAVLAVEVAVLVAVS